MTVYDKYKQLLNGQTAQETEDFFSDPDRTLAAFSKVTNDQLII